MEHYSDNGTVTIRLCSRIDSNNAAEVEKEIFDRINSSASVILDAADTQYISSAGLRVVLKLKKTVPDSKIINASPEVYEIFEITGFPKSSALKRLCAKYRLTAAKK